MVRAVFFDRDGVVNTRLPEDYIKVWDEFHFNPEIFTVLPQLKSLGYLAIIVSNQRGVARGIMSESDVDLIHDTMQKELEERCGTSFDCIYVCPHGDEDNCDCRKPKPGMIITAADEWDIDCSESWLIGDSETDIQAGNSAGCRTILLGDAEESRADYIASTLGDAGMIIEHFI